MSAHRLASRYAKSLLDLAVEKKELDAVHKDIERFNAVVKVSSEFRAMLRNPEINSDKKRAVFQKLFPKTSDVTRAFFDIVLKKNREAFLPDFAQAFIDLYNRHNDITVVTLTTAVEPNNATLMKVKQVLKEKAGVKNIELIEKVDPAIIGGFVLEYDGKMIDYSISRRLEILDDQFKDNAYIRKF